MSQPRRKRRVICATVLRKTWITPHMIRLVFGGKQLTDFDASIYADHYVKLLFPPENVTYPTPVDLETIRRDMPREQWPRTRTYTVRAWDQAALELTIDFVYHGNEGLAGPWAAQAQPGDELCFSGPGGAYAPGPEADWHLFVGDESALPAISASLERLPAGVPARVFVEIAGPEEEQKLLTDAEVVWVHRGGRPVGHALVETVRGMDFPPGMMQAFVHGEAHFVKDLRRLLLVEHGVPREHVSISGYWRHGSDEDGWQSSKAEWNRVIAEEEANALSTD